MQVGRPGQAQALRERTLQAVNEHRSRVRDTAQVGEAAATMKCMPR